MSMVARVDGADGFAPAGTLEPAELHTVRTLIEARWRAVLERCAGVSAGQIAGATLERYHELQLPVSHTDLWPKHVRLLARDAVASILRMSLFRRLADELGDFLVSDEESLGWENIYWRLVRPRQSSDVGPLHADRWFWELGHGTMPAGYRRLKIWVAVASEPGRNGLRVVPGSHRRIWRYHGELRHGRLKPRLDEGEGGIETRLIPTAPGDAIMFHDSLLHGGAVNLGDHTRVSFEMTLFVPTPPL